MEAVVTRNVSDVIPMSMYDDVLNVIWFNAHEGLHGPYNADDPTDVEMLRFDVYVNTAKKYETPVWRSVRNASYCTQVPVNTNEDTLEKLLRGIFNQYREEITGFPVKKSVRSLGEALSWISPGDEEYF